MNDDKQGFVYLCDIFSIITNNLEKREKYRQFSRSGNSFHNGEKDSLVSEWTLLAKRAIANTEDIKDLLYYYHYISNDNKEDEFGSYCQDVQSQLDSKGGRTTLSNAFNNILVNQRGTRPYFLFGIAMTIVLAVGNYQSDTIFIGIEEAKEILFKAMRWFDYDNVEYIPDYCFADEINFKHLLLVTLYHSLQVAFPYKKEHKERNYTVGQNLVKSTIDSSLDSELFSAIKAATEASSIISLLWAAQDSRCNSSLFHEYKDLSFEQCYSVPEVESASGFGVLSCDSHFRIRSFIEGKSGSGKSCLAKAIVLMSRGKIVDSLIKKRLSKELGLFGDRYTPMILDSKELLSVDLKEKSLIESALDQLYFNALEVFSGDPNHKVTLRHYKECYAYILKYIQRKAQSEELLLIIDSFSKVDNLVMPLLVDNLRRLYKDFPSLHIVVLSDRLKPSELMLFKEYDKFKINNENYLGDFFEKFKQQIPSGNMLFEEIVKNLMAHTFSDSPRRLLRYMQESPVKSIVGIAIDDLEEEIEKKCGYDIDPRICKEFLVKLAYRALLGRNRSGDSIIIPNRIVDRNFLMDLNMAQSEELWKHIQSRRILLDQVASVNSYEFNNPLYFDCLLTDYLLDILEQESEVSAAGQIVSVLSKLSGTEFARIIVNIIIRASNFEYSLVTMKVSEENLGLLIKIIAGIGLSYEDQNELKHLIWALDFLLKDETLMDHFISCGKYDNRKRMIVLLSRLKHALVNL